MNRIYLDYSATTPIAEEVFEAMRPFYVEQYGNASSIHGFGRAAKVAIDAARETIARALNAHSQEIVFTSGGSEANNAAIRGIAQTHTEPKHIITSLIEHPCVLETCRALGKNGWKVSYVEPDQTGVIAPGAVERAIRPDTVLISVMHANNEIGTINPIEEIAEIASERKISFHTDAVQTFGKIQIDLSKAPISLLSLSGHKIYAPKGVGALFIRRGLKIDSLIHGGQQERGRRAGTENVPGIVGLGKAVELMMTHLDNEKEKLHSLTTDFLSRLKELYPNIVLNSHPKNRLPGILNLSFPGFDSLALVMSLDLQEIAVSNGSACSSGSVEPSHVLRAMKVGNARANSAIRISLGKYTTEEELNRTIEAFKQILQRRFRKTRKERIAVPA